MDARLIAYVRAQRDAGYSDSQIAQVLLNQGYPQSLVDAALSSAQNPTVADSQLLASFVRTYLDQQYSKEQIRASLLQQGYAPKDVERAFQSVFPSEHKISHVSLILFPLLALCVILGGYFLITSLESEPASLPVVREAQSLSQVLDNLLPLAQRNPTAALALCESLIESDQPRCILTVSRESSNPSYCPDISDARLRDTCYLEFIYDGNLEYCDKLSLPGNVEYCDTARSLGA